MGGVQLVPNGLLYMLASALHSEPCKLLGAPQVAHRGKAPTPGIYNTLGPPPSPYKRDTILRVDRIRL